MMTMMKNTVAESFDTVLKGLEVCIEFERTTTYERDLHYGADADGNRGISMLLVDDDVAEDIKVTIEDTDIQAPFLSLTPELQIDVQQAVDDYMEKHDPQQFEEPEPDYDDQDEDE